MNIEDSIPTAEELFRSRAAVETAPPSAWVGDSVAVALVDRECARLIVNCIFDPPIIEEEIDKYARRFKLPRNQAEEELRRGRRYGNG